MRRRLQNLATLLSLLLCAATVVMWVRSYRNNGHIDARGIGDFFAISGDGSLSVFHRIPDGVSEMDFHYWKWVMAFLAVPVMRLVPWWRERRRPQQGICSNCSYNLTGNTSGVCPECGTAVQAAAA